MVWTSLRGLGRRLGSFRVMMLSVNAPRMHAVHALIDRFAALAGAGAELGPVAAPQSHGGDR